MKKKKLNSSYESNDTKEIKGLIIITLIISVLAVGLYFLTDKVLNKDTTTKTTTTAKINYDICTVGTMFSRPYSEYYVFLFDSTSDNNTQYQSLLSTYKAKDKAIKIYYVDLNNKFNSPYVSDNSNTKPTKASEVKIKGSALVLIKNGIVSKYYETTSDYEKVLS
jgi:hypothetical protein